MTEFLRLNRDFFAEIIATLAVVIAIFCSPWELQAEQPKSKSFEIKSGDTLEVELLAGVNVLRDGTPQPVVIKVLKVLKGDKNLPVQDSRIIAAASGSLPHRRVLYRLSTLNFSQPCGKRKVYDVVGIILGEDGIEGMKGELLPPTSDSSNVDRGIVITPSGLSPVPAARIVKPSEEMSDSLSKRQEQLLPQIRVLAGTKGTAVFSKSLTLSDLQC